MFRNIPDIAARQFYTFVWWRGCHVFRSVFVSRSVYHCERIWNYDWPISRCECDVTRVNDRRFAQSSCNANVGVSPTYISERWRTGRNNGKIICNVVVACAKSIPNFPIGGGKSEATRGVSFVGFTVFFQGGGSSSGHVFVGFARPTCGTFVLSMFVATTFLVLIGVS